MIPALVIAGVSSGVGKTTLTLGLLEGLKRRGLRVRAFKIGPDFIDPSLHERITGRPSYNLDGWMCGRERVVATVARHAANADLALVEGMMGCFDGLDGRSEDGSTAQVAKWLGAPVVLVVDAGALARSAGALVLGFERFDPDLVLAAVVFNRVAGETHFRWLRESLPESCRARVAGFLPTRPHLALPERHLGLVTAAEGILTPALLAELAKAVEESVDLDLLLGLARSRVALALSEGTASPQARVRIGVARDPAFQFYYPANLDLLRRAGAELVFWSPLRDTDLPDVDALYLGGGYPEVHARRLGANTAMLEAVKAFADADGLIYAECGGLMYLAEALEDEGGELQPMVGLLPATVRMRPKRLTLGYAEVEITRDTPIAPAGTIARGHRFHASWVEAVPAWVPRAYAVRTTSGGVPGGEGYLIGNALMSYVHLHFESNPAVAEHLVAGCRRRVRR